MNNQNKVRLRIAGADYVIVTEESESYALGLADEINERLKKLSRENPHVSTTGGLILVTLDMCDEARRANVAADNLRGQLSDYLTEAAKARNEAEELRRECGRLMRENQLLRAELNSGRSK